VKVSTQSQIISGLSGFFICDREVGNVVVFVKCPNSKREYFCFIISKL